MSAHNRIPESRARVLPAGTAPPESTYAPRNDFNVLAAEEHQLAMAVAVATAATATATETETAAGPPPPRLGETHRRDPDRDRDGVPPEECPAGLVAKVMAKHATLPESRGDGGGGGGGGGGSGLGAAADEGPRSRE